MSRSPETDAPGLARPLPLPTAGDRFGRYVLLQEIGVRQRFSRTRVFLALDRSSMEEVVLTLPDSDSGPEHATTRYQYHRCVDQARRSGHAQSTRVLAGGVLLERFYLCSQWIAGVDLGTLLEHGPLTLEGSLRLLWEIANALAGLHAEGRWHGDLRPGNVILTTDGDPVLVGLVPFPLTCPSSSRRCEEPIPRYTAPEWHQRQETSAEGDVYSLALLAVELLSGRHLLEPQSAAGFHRAQLLQEEYFASGARLARSIPEPLAEVLQEMLRVDRRERPSLEGRFIRALIDAMPAWSSRSRLDEILGAPLRRALDATRERLLEGSSQALEQGRLLTAASLLNRFSELWPLPGEAVIERCAERIRDCLWETFRLTPGSDPEHPERLQGGAALTQLFRASFNLGLSGLISLCRHRLRLFSRPESPLTSLLPTEEEGQALARRAPVLREYLRRNPAHQNALLGLALTEERPFADGPRDLDAWKARLLERQGIPNAALVYASRQLIESPEDRELLERLARLAQASLEAPGEEQGAETPERGEGVGLAGEARVASTQTGVLRDAESLFLRGQARLQEGAIQEAAGFYLRLLESGSMQEEHFHAVLCQEVRNMLWSALPRSGGPAPDPTCLGPLLELLERLGLPGLLPLWDRLALALVDLPGGPDGAEVLTLRPGSATLLTALGEPPLDHRPHPEAGLTLVEALLRQGEVEAAAGALAGTSPEAPESEARKRLVQDLEEARSRQREAEAAFAQIRDGLGEQSPEDALVACEVLLERFPRFLPALEEACGQALRAGDSARAAHHSMRSAARHLARGSLTAAQEAYRTVIRCEPGNPEALLFLAVLSPPSPEHPGNSLELRVEVLEREGLVDAAVHQVRRELRGTLRDLPLYQLLVRICRDAGRDPSAYLLAQGHLLHDEDPARARELFREAVEAAENRERVVDSLLRSPGVRQLFSPTELLRLRG